MSQFLCIGDYICLYCEETDGYVYSMSTSSYFNNLAIYHKQDRNQPINIPDPQMITFQMCIQNRYKLNKKFLRKYATLENENVLDSDTKALAEQARNAAEAENVDNLAEQRRNQNKKVRYGEVIQLRQGFSDKYIHVTTTQTSQKDKNNMMITLNQHNDKSAQFKILPRYKVKSEGEYVQIFDQIILESIKSPGHFFHASLPFYLDNFYLGSELNLGVEQSGFTIVKSYSHFDESEQFVRGGQFVQLFHKEMEAYIVAEGLFDDCVTEQVHLRIREIDQLNARTLRTSNSAITYWQIESEKSIINGDKLTWDQQFRFRHVTTRMYLAVDEESNVTLLKESRDPRTVFKLHPVIQDVDELTYESYARIEHVLSGNWLHALKDKEYKRQQFNANEDERSMQALRWDGGELRKVNCVHDRQYDDAYTIQKVYMEYYRPFNFIAGIVPFIRNLIEDRMKEKFLSAKEAYRVCMALREIKDFMMIDGKTVKARQKLLRNLRVIDQIVRLLKMPLYGQPDESNFLKIHLECYDILYTYMIGSSRKNALYFAKYIELFETQMLDKSEISLKVVLIIVELIRDNRKIVDRISKIQINQFVEALRTNENYRYLELLKVLCVCNSVGIVDNQTYIAQKWLLEDRRGVYLTERGQNIHEQPNILYVSTDCAKSWAALNKFLQADYRGFDDEKVLFLRTQLDLFNAICYGRNEYCIKLITKDLSYLSWEEAFLSLQSEILPDDIRAKYCEMIIGLFVDVGNNYSVVDSPERSFVYEYVGTKDQNRTTTSDQYAAKDLVTIFPALRDWIAAFLEENTYMIASKIEHNMLLEQVLRLLNFLVKFGYYGDVDDVRNLLEKLIRLTDGTRDLPFPPERQGKELSKEKKKIIQKYQQTDRYLECKETKAIVNAKFSALEVLQMILNFEANARLAGFMAKFKDCEKNEGIKKKNPSSLSAALYEGFEPYDKNSAAMRKQKIMQKELRDMFESTTHVKIDQMTNILIDLAQYKYAKINQLSLNILNLLYSGRADTFQSASESLMLMTTDSCCVHREVAKQIPLLRMMAKSKWSDEQVMRMENIFTELIEFCHLPKAPEEPHPMNQRILDSHNVINVIMEILSVETDSQLSEKYSQIEKVLRKALQLLRAMTLKYPDVQVQVFENLDLLLRVNLVESELAITLKEVFVNNQNLCLKILPRQIHRIVSLAAEHQQKAPEFLDLLCAFVKVEGMGLALKRNQTLVMKYIMQSYSKVAYILEQSLETRESVLKEELGEDHVQYFISLIDLLATCAEGENRYIESLCQTIISVEEILNVLNHPEIANHLKRPFLKYLMFAYLKKPINSSDSNTAEILKERNIYVLSRKIWQFISNLSEEIFYLTQYINEAPHELIFYILAKSFPKHLKTHLSCNICTELVSEDPNKPLKLNNENATLRVKEDEFRAHASIHYIFDSVIPFLHLYSRQVFLFDNEDNKAEKDIYDGLTRSMVNFCSSIASAMVNPNHLKAMIGCLTHMVPKSTFPPSIMEPIVERIGKGEKIIDTITQMKEGNKEYYNQEVKMNLKLKTFAANCSLIYGGHNTVQAQMKVSSNRDYTTLNGDDLLPLGDEFQNHLKCFILPNTKKIEVKYKMAILLIDQLYISTCTATVGINSTTGGARKKRLEQEKLDIRCLQLLRAMIHNEERKLPEDWQTRTSELRIKKGLKNIVDIQNTLNSFKFDSKILAHLANPSDQISKEVLSLQAMMLFNANHDIQKSLLDYFLETKEEVFFYAVRNRLQLSMANIKERKLLLAQQISRKKEASEQAKNLSTTMTLGNRALKEIKMLINTQRMENAVNSLSNNPKAKGKPKKDHVKHKAVNGKLPKSEKNNENKVLKENIKYKQSNSTSKLLGKEAEELILEPMVVVNSECEEEQEEDFTCIDGDDDEISMKDDGYIELVLKLLARICDGQHPGLQTYLREQPDNIKSFNLIAEVVQFLNVVYANINKDTIDLVSQVFSTINEFVAGNQENRLTVYDNKIIDYINYILRGGTYSDCSFRQMIDLRQNIGNLLISLIEENNPDATQIANEVKDTLDKEAIYRVMTEAHEMHESEHLTPEGIIDKKNQSKSSICGKLLMKEKVKDLQDDLFDLGFSYYNVLARLYDLDPNMGKRVPGDNNAKNPKCLIIKPNQQKAFKFYRKNSFSIELLKGEYLQKVHFRIKNKNILREEVREKVKWNVDRSSPSNKIRDFMDWSKAILNDIRYQRKVMNNPITKFFTGGWILWNYAVTLLSVILNLAMLVTYQAPKNGAFAENVTIQLKNNELPLAFKNPSPVWDSKYTYLKKWVSLLGLIHNVLCGFLLLTYFLADHPAPPRFKHYFNVIKKKINRSKIDSADEQVIDHGDESTKMTSHLISSKTFYYLSMLGFSLAGQWYSSYFFAFHLINIVQNNQLLQGVISAVTQNGKSLIWVAILGIVVIYLYAIIGFAFFRPSFIVEKNLYCDTLWHCLVTVIRFGLVGDLFENLLPHDSEKSFFAFSLLVIYHITFFILISTIGLNIIFGIIVDTFSELRDLKWTAESDMRDTCFICSRNSYDFEHHGLGFDHHVLNEHNMWSYIFFFIHLQDTKANDYTSLDMHVAMLLKDQKFDFFPLNRALCLTAKDEDSTDSKIDELLKSVNILISRQKTEDSERKRFEELLRQKRWQKRHRGFMSNEGSLEKLDEDGNETNLSLMPGGNCHHSTLLLREDVVQDRPYHEPHEPINKGGSKLKVSMKQQSDSIGGESGDSDYALGEEIHERTDSIFCTSPPIHLPDADILPDPLPPVDYPIEDPLKFLDDYGKPDSDGSV